MATYNGELVSEAEFIRRMKDDKYERLIRERDRALAEVEKLYKQVVQLREALEWYADANVDEALANWQHDTADDREVRGEARSEDCLTCENGTCRGSPDPCAGEGPDDK